VRRLAVACAVALSLGMSFGCADQARVNKQNLNEKCGRNLDCLYGLECVESGSAQSDGGAAGKSCQYQSFADCEGDSANSSGLDGGTADPATISGQQQCLSGQRCRNGHCTVQCAAKGDCKDNEICKIGICQRSSGKNAQCYDNRDCPWPETCFYGQCATRQETQRCHTDLDCGVGFRCINGRCQ
jgi:hypothetical protein